MREQGPVPCHNLFRRKDTADLYCAVPESRPIPPFIRTPAWEFAGQDGPLTSGAGLSAREPRVSHADVGLLRLQQHQLRSSPVVLIDPIGWGLCVALVWQGSHLAADTMAVFYSWLGGST
jgi:hypothetical protein